MIDNKQDKFSLQMEEELNQADKELTENSIFDYEALNIEFFTTLDEFYKAYGASTPLEVLGITNSIINGLCEKQMDSPAFIKQVANQIKDLDMPKEDTSILVKNMGLALKALIRMAITGTGDDLLIISDEKNYVDLLRMRKQLMIMMKMIISKITDDNKGDNLDDETL